MSAIAPQPLYNSSPVTVDDANAEAAGTAKKPLTRKEWKNLMRLYFTVRRPVVEGCGHKIEVERPPKNNCEVCWFAWFNNHGEIVQSTLQADKRFVVQIFGEKFLKMFNRFMATVARLAAEGKIKESDVESFTGTGSELAPTLESNQGRFSSSEPNQANSPQ